MLPTKATVEFDSRVCGIPCKILAHIEYGHDGGLYEPPCPTEVDITVLDTGGNPAPWLASKLSHSEITRIENEALEEDAALWSDY